MRTVLAFAAGILLGFAGSLVGFVWYKEENNLVLVKWSAVLPQFKSEMRPRR